MTTGNPSPGNDTGLPKQRAPICEDDLAALNALTLAIELCSDVIMGFADEKIARNALPGLVELQRSEVERLCEHACSGKRRDA